MYRNSQDDLRVQPFLAGSERCNAGRSYVDSRLLMESPNAMKIHFATSKPKGSRWNVNTSWARRR